MEKQTFVDKTGRAFTEERLGTATRAEVARNILSFMLSDPDRTQQFFSSALAALPEEHYELVQTPDGSVQAKFEPSDPMFQDFCVLYGTQTVMNEALDENLSDAYQYLTVFTGSIKYKMQDTVNLTEQEIADLERYYAPIPELLLAEQICGIQLEIAQKMTGNSEQLPTSFQTNRIQSKIDAILPYLTEEQCAAAYYNVSLMHRAQLSEKDYYDPSENNAEKECLKKVLEYTSDYNRINYCLNRLGSGYNNQGLIRAAYRRALNATENPNDVFRLNAALAECYVNDYHPKIGYKTAAEQQTNKEDQKLDRAEHHYQVAFEMAPKEEKVDILKKIGKLQLRRAHIDDWTRTQTKIAFDFMEGESRCKLLMDVASRNTSLKRPYLERAIMEAVKAKKFPKNDKSLMIRKAATALRPIYEKEKDTSAMAKLEQIVEKYAPIKAETQNPLAAYKCKKAGKDLDFNSL